MVKVLVSHPEHCTGCRFCQMICSLYHESVVDPRKARLRVERPDILNDIPVVCTQCITCGDSCCVEHCPQDAISIKEGAVLIDDEMCTGCGVCETVCPYGVIHVNDVAYKCDLCGGDPVCVKFCPSGALVYEEADENSFRSMIEKLEGL